MNDFTLTDFLAWYGALLASFVAAFELWKWSRSRAWLRVTIRPQVYYDNGEVLRVDNVLHGESRELQSYFHIEITNQGELPTTLLTVFATTERTSLFEKLANKLNPTHPRFNLAMASGAFTAHFGKNLPVLLGPGEVWSCRVDEPRIYSLKQGGTPKLVINAACFNTPKFIKFPLKGDGFVRESAPVREQ